MKILIVDDHPILREGVASVLIQMPEVSEVLQCSDGQQAIESVNADPALGLVVVDLRMTKMGGIVVVELLHKRHPRLPVMVLSSSEDPEDVRRALAAGARGYCPKSGSPASLLAAVRLVISGEIYVPPLMAMGPAAVEARPDGTGLTTRQREVLNQLCSGLSNKQIAQALGLEEKTVKAHITAIFKALKVVHRLQAVEAARAAGLAS